MKWISVEERLPELGQYVLAKHNRKSWVDEDPNVNCVVVKRVPDKEIMGNNEKPYQWIGFGTDSFWGQEIDSWMEIPT